MKRLVFFIIKNIIYVLTSLMPKKKGLILFGSWFGTKFADNPKYLFLTAIKDKRITPVWVTKSKNVYRQLKGKKYPVVYFYSFASVWMHVRASSYVTATGKVDVLYWLTGRARHIELWHGIPLKKIVYADSFGLGREKIWITNAKNKFHNLKYVITYCSKSYKEIYKEAFRVQEKNLVCYGQPRNDVFYDSELEDSCIISPLVGAKYILYMPTHRQEGKEIIDLNHVLDLRKINGICQKHGLIFCIKKHHYHSIEHSNLENYSNIIDVTSEDVDSQILMKYASILITDYSSCYIDYLLLNRPIIMYPYDIDKYQSKDRELYFSYKNVIPGNICYDKKELCENIEKLCSDKDMSITLEQIKCRDFFYDQENQKCVSDKFIDLCLK